MPKLISKRSPIFNDYFKLGIFNILNTNMVMRYYTILKRHLFNYLLFLQT